MQRTAAALVARLSRPRCASSVPPRASGGRKKIEKDVLGALHELDLLGDEPQNTLRCTVDALGSNSFTVNGLLVHGSVMLFPHFATVWNVDKSTDVVPDSFALLKVLRPRPNILILGTGEKARQPRQDVREALLSLNVNMEFMDSANACHTFNVLNHESRNVAAAILPTSAS